MTAKIKILAGVFKNLLLKCADPVVLDFSLCFRTPVQSAAHFFSCFK